MRTTDKLSQKAKRDRKHLAHVAMLATAVLPISGCNNCHTYQARSAAGVTVGERWSRLPSEDDSYACIEGRTDSPNAGIVTSYGPECQHAPEFSVDFKHHGEQYIVRVRDGVVVSVGRRGYCIDL